METTTSEDLPVRGRLFIPAIGDRFRLTAPWRFTLTFERRNLKFAHHLKLITAEESKQWGLWVGERYGKYRSAKAELPEGTVLECDRIYVRQYNKGRLRQDNDYDSVTWKAMTAEQAQKSKPKLLGRFWVKLPDAYAISYELQWDSLYRDRVKVVDQVHDL